MTHVAQKLAENIMSFKHTPFQGVNFYTCFASLALVTYLFALHIYMPQSPLAQNQTHTRSIFILFSIHIFIHNHF